MPLLGWCGHQVTGAVPDKSLAGTDEVWNGSEQHENAQSSWGQVAESAWRWCQISPDVQDGPPHAKGYGEVSDTYDNDVQMCTL